MGIYDNIKKLCKRDGITVKHMEEVLDITRSSTCKWNKKLPTINSIIKVADYFSVSIDWLLGREDSIEFTDEQAMIDVRISDDLELKEAIEKYYTLSDDKKKHIIEMISLLSEE